MITKIFAVAIIPFFFFIANANCLNNRCFDKEIIIDNQQVPIAGFANLKYYFFDVYDAVYYSSDTQPVSKSSPDQIRVLTIYYKISFNKEDFAKAGDDQINKFIDVNINDFKSALETLNAAYVDVKEGDSYTLQYIPEKGTSLILNNNKVLVTVPGAEFAKLYFRIWLDKENPIDEELRNNLLKTR